MRACGFKNGGMALYSCQEIADGPQNAIKYFFPGETARTSATLDSYNAHLSPATPNKKSDKTS